MMLKLKISLNIVRRKIMSNKKSKKSKSTWEFVDGIRLFDCNPYVNMNRFRKSVDDVILENQLNGQKEALIYAIDCNNKQNAQYEKEIRKI